MKTTKIFKIWILCLIIVGTMAAIKKVFIGSLIGLFLGGIFFGPAGSIAGEILGGVINYILKTFIA